MTFQEAVESSKGLENSFQKGLGALGNHKGIVHASDTFSINGSVDIDEAMKEAYPNANRWDYTIGYADQAYFVEVHPADSSQVAVMQEKLTWLKTMLKYELQPLDKIKANRPYYWVYTNRVNIPKHTPQYRRAVSMGLLPVKSVELV